MFRFIPATAINTETQSETVCAFVRHLLKNHHGDIHNGNIIDGIRYQTGLIIKTLRIAHIVANSYAPGQEEDLADGQTVIPPVVRALLELKLILIVDLDWRYREDKKVVSTYLQLCIYTEYSPPLRRAWLIWSRCPNR